MPNSGPGALVYIRYLDHVLFRRMDPTVHGPAVREAVGWLLKEDGRAVWILWDRSVEGLPQERTRAEESGLVILKSDIIEMRRLA